MATRPTKNITLPDGSVVTLKTYLTVREEDLIQGVWTENASITQAEKKEDVRITGIKPETALMARNKVLEIMIVSIQPAAISEGETPESIVNPNDVIDWVLNLPSASFKMIQKEIDALTDPKGS